MSTILKALRRVEDDRAAKDQRPLREAVTSGGASERRKRRRLPWPVVALLVLGAGFGAGALAFWSVTGDDAAPEVLAAAPQRAASPAPTPVQPPSRERAVALAAGSAAREEPAAEVALPPRELPPEAFASSVALLERPAAAPRIDAEADAEVDELEPGAAPRMHRGVPLLPPDQVPGRHLGGTVPTPQPQPVARREPTPQPRPVARREPAPQPTKRVARAEPEPRRVVQPAPPQRTTPAPAPEARPRPTSAGQQTAAAPAPRPTLRSAAPPKPVGGKSTPPPASVARAGVPDLLVERTSWHPSAARRTAMIQMDADAATEVHEGDAVGPLVVSRIEPSAVVFLHEGVEIRRRVGQR